MMRTCFVFLGLTLFLWIAMGCSAASFPVGGQKTAAPLPSVTDTNRGYLTIYAAASLTEAFTEMGQVFEKLHPGTQVEFSFAGSQVLRTQLEQGAQADIYASADTQNMELLVRENLVAEDAVQVFAKNKLIVIVPASNPARVQSLADLAKPNVKVVLADSSVPAGNYARQMLENLDNDPGYGAGFASQVLGNVVSNETDVRQVVTKISLGEADAGIVYASDAVSAAGIVTLSIPGPANVIAQYPIAIMQASHQQALAEAFMALVLSADGQATLKKWGFEVVK